MSQRQSCQKIPKSPCKPTFRQLTPVPGEQENAENSTEKANSLLKSAMNGENSVFGRWLLCLRLHGPYNLYMIAAGWSVKSVAGK